MTLPYKLSTSEVWLQDQQIDMDILTEDSHDALFELKKLNQRSYERDNHAIMSLNIEMNLDRIKIAREAHGFLDVLADLGGI